jgi:hypothetical protein
VRQPSPGFLVVRETDTYKVAVAGLQKGQRDQLGTRVALLIQDRAHPSLKAHSVKPDKYYWEAYLNKGDRIIYIPDGSTLILVDVVPHDDISRYSKRPRNK